MGVATLSTRGAQFIGGLEGFVPNCYDDQGHNCTIGYGHLVHYGPTTDADRRRWGEVTRPQALRLLQSDAHLALLALERYVSVPLRQEQIDSLCSFVYNCGAGSLQGTTVQARVNARPRWLWQRKAWRQSVADALLAWDHVGGQVSAGLQRRRQAEGFLFTNWRYTRAQGNPFANA